MGRCGITPLIRVRGGGSGSVSVAGLACYRPGHRTRLIYRLHHHRGRKGETKAFLDLYRDLLTAAHQLPNGNLVLIPETSLSTCARRCAPSSPPSRGCRCSSSYAPDLNPVERDLV